MISIIRQGCNSDFHLLPLHPGLFFHFSGMRALVSTWMAAVAGIYFFCRHTVPNQRALKSVEGYIIGNAARYAEREQVFALERTLLPDSAQYIQFYRMHPELEQIFLLWR